MRERVPKDAVRIPRLANPVERSIAIGNEEYQLLSPIIIDLERGVISFGVQRDITATDGNVYTISERIVLHDGIESKSVKLPNGKATTATAQVSRFSDAWSVIGESLKEALKRGIAQVKGHNQQTQDKGE